MPKYTIFFNNFSTFRLHLIFEPNLFSFLFSFMKSLLCPHILGGFQVESMPSPCGFHGFHMEYFWLRAQPFFHVYSIWKLHGIFLWNPGGMRWNPSHSIIFQIDSMDSILFLQISSYSIWILFYSTQIPWISHGFYMDA